jgi:hypothetical protein
MRFPVMTIADEPKRSIRMPDSGAAGSATRLAAVRPSPITDSGRAVVFRK